MCLRHHIRYVKYMDMIQNWGVCGAQPHILWTDHRFCWVVCDWWFSLQYKRILCTFPLQNARCQYHVKNTKYQLICTSHTVKLMYVILCVYHHICMFLWCSVRFDSVTVITKHPEITNQPKYRHNRYWDIKRQKRYTWFFDFSSFRKYLDYGITCNCFTWYQFFYAVRVLSWYCFFVCTENSWCWNMWSETTATRGHDSFWWPGNTR